MTFSFSALNLNGMSGLLSGVLRCWHKSIVSGSAQSALQPLHLPEFNHLHATKKLQAKKSSFATCSDFVPGWLFFWLNDASRRFGPPACLCKMLPGDVFEDMGSLTINPYHVECIARSGR